MTKVRVQIGQSERLLQGIDRPAPDYRVSGHVAWTRATHVLIERA